MKERELNEELQLNCLQIDMLNFLVAEPASEKEIISEYCASDLPPCCFYIKHVLRTCDGNCLETSSASSNLELVIKYVICDLMKRGLIEQQEGERYSVTAKVNYDLIDTLLHKQVQQCSKMRRYVIETYDYLDRDVLQRILGPNNGEGNNENNSRILKDDAIISYLREETPVDKMRKLIDKYADDSGRILLAQDDNADNKKPFKIHFLDEISGEVYLIMQPLFKISDLPQIETSDTNPESVFVFKANSNGEMTIVKDQSRLKVLNIYAKACEKGDYND
ncbi:MAG: hypothetical protein IKJ07_07995 [Clostridia bacterium]|nr:hypothetical protein [Clostridia bacterium]